MSLKITVSWNFVPFVPLSSPSTIYLSTPPPSFFMLSFLWASVPRCLTIWILASVGTLGRGSYLNPQGAPISAFLIFFFPERFLSVGPGPGAGSPRYRELVMSGFWISTVTSPSASGPADEPVGENTMMGPLFHIVTNQNRVACIREMLESVYILKVKEGVVKGKDLSRVYWDVGRFWKQAIHSLILFSILFIW